MRLATYKIYQFNELNDEAKEKARDWYRQFPFDWCSESLASINYFCDCFGIKLTAYEIDLHSYFYRTMADNSHFKGLSFKRVQSLDLSDGYCIGEGLKINFLDKFKELGALKAFDYAINEAFKEWREDLRYQSSDEYIDEVISGNNYEFYANGERA